MECQTEFLSCCFDMKDSIGRNEKSSTKQGSVKLLLFNHSAPRNYNIDLMHTC